MTPTTAHATRQFTGTQTAGLPAPAASHATCCWCHREFASIGELLEHAEHHL